MPPTLGNFFGPLAAAVFFVAGLFSMAIAWEDQKKAESKMKEAERRLQDAEGLECVAKRYYEDADRKYQKAAEMQYKQRS